MAADSLVAESLRCQARLRPPSSFTILDGEGCVMFLAGDENGVRQLFVAPFGPSRPAGTAASLPCFPASERPKVTAARLRSANRTRVLEASGDVRR
jgi:hypothetical protein